MYIYLFFPHSILNTPLSTRLVLFEVRDVQGGTGALHLPRDGDPVGQYPSPRGYQAYVPRRRQGPGLL